MRWLKSGIGADLMALPAGMMVLLCVIPQVVFIVKVTLALSAKMVI